MPAQNTAAAYGSVARSLHWLTALLILTAIPLGLYANSLPFDTGEALAEKARVFSLHKTIGVTAFFVALIRILWAVTQPRPAPLHPDRRVETALAAVVHWALYLSLVLVPLTGWVHHAATTGFAPILWPFGQDLPLVPKSPAVEHLAASLHFVFTKVLVASILLHIAGGLKHALIDRDGTMARMITGRAADVPAVPHRSRGPVLAALAIYAAGAGVALSLTGPEPAAAPAAPLAEVQAGGNWQVQDGTLAISVRQMGADVAGSFASWTAEITFDETAVDGKHGSVLVKIDTASVTLGSVSDQVKGPDFFDAANHTSATFTADILPGEAGGYIAEGTLSLRGQPVPVSMPFALIIEGDTARMTGQTTVDRRDFGMGVNYPDEASVGFTVTVDAALTAVRKAE